MARNDCSTLDEDEDVERSVVTLDLVGQKTHPVLLFV